MLGAAASDAARQSFDSAEPYTHVKLPGLFDEARLLALTPAVETFKAAKNDVNP